MAKVELNAETLKKQHFWVLQLFFIIPFLVAVICVFGVSDATAEKITKSEAEKKKIDGTKAESQFKRDKLEEQKVKLFARLDKMWEAAWNTQKAIYEWPQGLQPQHRDALKDLKFGTDLESLRKENKFPDLDSLRDQFHEQYVKEFQALPQKVSPMFFNGGLEAVVKYQKKFTFKPSSEDLYLAMEDLWVQSIIVDTIDSVNRAVAKFEPVGATPANKLNRKFRSPCGKSTYRSKSRTTGRTAGSSARSRT